MPRWQCLARISLPAEIVEELDRSADFDGRDFRVGHAERAESVQLQVRRDSTQARDRSIYLLKHGRRGSTSTITVPEKHQALIGDAQIFVVPYALDNLVTFVRPFKEDTG
jgi:hypothetical protein